MSSAIMNPSPSSHSSRNGRVSFGAQSSTHSLLLERAKANSNRRPTPDSEAMVSSDEEHSNGPAPPSARRASASRQGNSWLGDIGHPQPARKYSLGGLSVGSNSSQPPTPSSETTPRLTPSNQGRSGSSVTFAGNIWTNDRGKDYSSRFSDTPHSPLSLAPLSSEAGPQAPRDRRYSGIGVDIPLKPTFKPQQQRAMSFSVTQQAPVDDDDGITPFHVQRLRTGTQISNVTRKASLSQVREDEDDNLGVKLHTDMDAGGSQNLLKRAIRHRTFSTNVPGYSESPWAHSQRRSSTLPVVENAIEEPEEVHRQAMPESRRHSLAHVATGSHGVPSLNTRSARESDQRTPDHFLHSPLSASTTLPPYDYPSSDHGDYFGANMMNAKYDPAGAPAQPQFHGSMNPALRSRVLSMSQSDQTALDAELEATQEVYLQRHKFALATTASMNTIVAPLHRQLNGDFDPVKPVKPINRHLTSYFGGYGIDYANTITTPNELSQYLEESDAVIVQTSEKTFHLIKFKCERAAVFYIPENTGLRIEKGQLVIVDGDRGYDIGEVEKANISLDEVKSLCQTYQEKHFIWLMMFSRARETNPTVRWALSNLDPHNASARHPENDAETESRAQNYKLIRRLAVPADLASLQEKEGDETKAKRVCQQKVLEHGLDMEILDAEFQLDRNKLTYFYYAEKYINFNELVNDLFKIFKTRIWMSAVNPASFAPGGHPKGHGNSPQQPARPMPVVPLFGAAKYAATNTLDFQRLTEAAAAEGKRREAAGMLPASLTPFPHVPIGTPFGLSSLTQQNTSSYNPPAYNMFARGYHNNHWGVPGAASTGPWAGSYKGSYSKASATGNANNNNNASPPVIDPIARPTAAAASQAFGTPNAPTFAYGGYDPTSNTNNSHTGLNYPNNTPAFHGGVALSQNSPTPTTSAPPAAPAAPRDPRAEAARAAFYASITGGVHNLAIVPPRDGRRSP